MNKTKPAMTDTDYFSIGITRNRGETWRECVARLVEEAGEGAVEDALTVFDQHAECTGHSWAALRACWDFLACERKGPWVPKTVDDEGRCFSAAVVSGEITPGVCNKLKLSKAQQRTLDEVKKDGRRVYNGRARRTIEILAKASLVEYSYDLVLHALGPATERYIVTLPRKASS